MSRQIVMEKITASKIVAVCRGIEPQQILSAANAVSQGGIRLLEITFDQRKEAFYHKTAEAIRLVREKGPGSLCIGAGTVMNLKQLEMAYEAGAEFILAPNVNRQIIERASQLGILCVPGALTPTEISAAYDMGADIVKVFPAGLLGSAYIKAIRGPISHIPLMAVGNIDQHNFREFLDSGCMSAGVGSCLMDKKLIEEGRFEELTALARKFTTEGS